MGNNINAATVSELNKLKISIRAELDNANSLAQQAVEKYIAAGIHLRQARSLMPGDKEFGQWRKKEFPDLSASWAGNLMRVSERFATSKLATLLPVSSLVELLPASEAIEMAVQEEAEAGNVPSVRDIRGRVSEATVPATSGPTSGASAEEGGEWLPASEEAEEATRETKIITPPEQDVVFSNAINRPPPVLTLEERAERRMKSPLPVRLDECKDPDDQIEALILFGLCPFTEFMPNNETVAILYEHYYEEAKGDRGWRQKIILAYKAILGEENEQEAEDSF